MERHAFVACSTWLKFRCQSDATVKNGAGVTLTIFQAQFQLFDLVIELLGLAAELHALKLGDEQFELLDFRSMRGNDGIALAHHGLQGVDIVRQVGVRLHAREFTQVRPCLQA